MADAFYGEIRAFPYTFAPQGWLLCNGAILPIGLNQALYAVIGPMYGGDGKTTFALPNLYGRAIMGYSNTATPAAGGPYAVAATLGQAVVSLATAQIPPHTHGMESQLSSVRVTTPGSTAVPSNPQYQPPGATRSYALGMYAAATLNPTLGAMSPLALSVAGGSGPHENRSPLLVMGYFICNDGVFPMRN
ncbi:phage tail protein [Niveispirillum sp. KHB5.9]|uniref:phage tail protein n=1 Tax=Niveispirillum sp. KHB5.9 TaxID=3400269 RepID=UPI003A89F7BF